MSNVSFNGAKVQLFAALRAAKNLTDAFALDGVANLRSLVKKEL
jgi:hypothetical protein